MCNKIDIYELKKLLNEKNLNLIDIRDNYSYLSGTIESTIIVITQDLIENAINISSNTLIENPSKYLDKNKKYYIFCNHGSSSEFLCNYLTKLGYDTTSIIGGYNSYIKDNK